MTEAVAVSGFSIPPAPAGSERGSAPPPAHTMQPGYVPTPATALAPPAPAANPAPADVPADAAAALSAALMQAQADKPAPAPAAPPAYDFAEDAGNDPVLASLNSVFSSVGVGIDMERALGKALSHGDASLIDMAYIAEKGGANAEALKNVAKAIVDRVQGQTEQATAAVYATAGGKAEWGAATAAFNQTAPQHLRAVVASMMDSGNPASIKHAAQAVVEFAKNSGLVAQPAGLVHAGASGMAAAQAISKHEFQDAMFKLDPNSRSYLEDRNTLMARRSLGKSLGK